MRRSLLFAAILSLGGCVVTPPEQGVPAAHWQAHKQRLQAMRYWYLSARLSINNGVEAWQLKAQWQQYADRYRIQLSGPFGTGQVRLDGAPGQVILRDTDDEVFIARDPDSLLYARTGVKMPVSGLRYWVLGVPDPATEAEETFDNQGRLMRITQGDWVIRLKRYTTVNGVELPEKLFIEKQDLDVRLVIDQWRLGAEAGDDAPWQESRR